MCPKMDAESDLDKLQEPSRISKALWGYAKQFVKGVALVGMAVVGYVTLKSKLSFGNKLTQSKEGQLTKKELNSESSINQDILQRRGKRSFEAVIQVSTSSNLERGTNVAYSSNDDFMVVWNNRGGDGSGEAVFGRTFDNQGNPLVAPFQINNYTLNKQYSQKVKSLQDDNFVATWASDQQDGSGFGIYAQKLDRLGNKIGNEFRVNNVMAGSQVAPDLTVYGSDKFMITWAGPDGSSTGIFARIFSSSSLASIGNEFQVNNYTLGDQIFPAIATLTGGDIVVTWESNGQDGSARGIYMQRLDQNGVKLGGEVQVNLNTQGDQYAPKVASFTDGGFAISWKTTDVCNGPVIVTQLFNGNGVRIGTEFETDSQFSYSNQGYTSTSFSNNLITISKVVGRYNSNRLRVDDPYYWLSILKSDVADSAVALSNGNLVITWSAGDGNVYTKIIANKSPSLITNKLDIEKGAIVKLTSNELFANDTDTPNPNLVFNIQNIFHGNFVLTQIPQTVLKTFTQQMLTNGEISFAHDGSIAPPRYEISVTDGVVDTAFAKASVNMTSPGIIGEEFLANKDGTPSIPTYSKITRVGANEYVAVWQRRGFSDCEIKPGIYGQLLGESGLRQGDTFTITDIFTKPSVTGLSTSDIIVAWGDPVGMVYAQKFSKNGTQLANKFIVTPTYSDDITLSTFSNGDILVVWSGTSINFADQDKGIFGKRFSSNGMQIGNEFHVNTEGLSAQVAPSVALTTNDQFYVVWQGLQTNDWDIYGQLFDNQTNKIGTEIRINTFTDRTQGSPVVEALEDNSFVAVWDSQGLECAERGVFSQRINPLGNKFGSEMRVSKISSKTQILPNIVTMDNGNVLIAWYGLQSYSPYVPSLQMLNGQFYNVNMTALGSAFGASSALDNFAFQPFYTNKKLINFSGNRAVAIWACSYGVCGKVVKANLPPTLVNNTLTITQGEKVTLTSSNLDAFDTDGQSNTLKYKISYINSGKFQLIARPGNAIAQFTQEQINDGKVQFVHDGSKFPPSYVVSVDDGVFATTNSSASIEFSPTLTNDGIFPLGLSSVSVLGKKFISVWLESNAQCDFPYKGIVGQQLDSSGVRTSKRFLVGREYSLYQSDMPEIKRIDDGKLLVVWSKLVTGSGSDHDICGQYLSDAGELINNPFVINNFTLGVQFRPKLVQFSDKSFVVSWLSNEPTYHGVFARHFDLLANPLGAEIKLNMGPQNQIRSMVLGELNNDKFVATWDIFNQDGSGYGVYARIFDKNLNPITDEFLVNTETLSNQQFPTVSKFENGDFVVVWQGGNDMIYGQKFNSAGTKVGAETELSISTSHEYPDVKSIANNNILVTFSPRSQSNTLNARVFNSTLAPLTTVFDVPIKHASSSPVYARLARLSGNEFVLAAGSYGDGAYNGKIINVGIMAQNITKTYYYELNTQLVLSSIKLDSLYKSSSPIYRVNLAMTDPLAGVIAPTSADVFPLGQQLLYNGSTGVWSILSYLPKLNTILSNLTFIPSAGYNKNFSIQFSATESILGANVSGNFLMLSQLSPSAVPAQSTQSPSDFSPVSIAPQQVAPTSKQAGGNSKSGGIAAGVIVPAVLLTGGAIAATMWHKRKVRTNRASREGHYFADRIRYHMNLSGVSDFNQPAGIAFVRVIEGLEKKSVIKTKMKTKKKKKVREKIVEKGLTHYFLDVGIKVKNMNESELNILAIDVAVAYFLKLPSRGFFSQRIKLDINEFKLRLGKLASKVKERRELDYDDSRGENERSDSIEMR